MLLLISFIVFVWLSVTTKTKVKYNPVANIGAPMFLILSPVNNHNDFIDYVQRPELRVSALTPLSKQIMDEVASYYGIADRVVYTEDRVDLYVLTFEPDNFFPQLHALTESIKLRTVTMRAINGGLNYITDREQPFFSHRPQFRKASLDLHRIIQQYPHLRVPPATYNYPTVRCRLILVAKSTVPTEQVDQVKGIIEQPEEHIFTESFQI